MYGWDARGGKWIRSVDESGGLWPKARLDSILRERKEGYFIYLLNYLINYFCVSGKTTHGGAELVHKTTKKRAESGEERHSNSVSTGCKKRAPGPPDTRVPILNGLLSTSTWRSRSPLPLLNSQNRTHRLRPTFAFHFLFLVSFTVPFLFYFSFLSSCWRFYV